MVLVGRCQSCGTFTDVDFVSLALKPMFGRKGCANERRLELSYPLGVNTRS